MRVLTLDSMRSCSSTVALRVFLLGALGALGCGAASAAAEDDDSSTTGDRDRDPTDTREVAKAGLGGCTNPQPLMAVDTGIFVCEEGFLHRAEERVCPSELPRDRVIALPGASADAGVAAPAGAGQYYECSQDTDCDDPLARCELIRTNELGPCSFGPVYVEPRFEARCVSGCREDADCGDGMVCVCGSPIGECQAVSTTAGCRSDADCAGAAQCLSNARTDNFGVFAFACELPADSCSADADCTGGSFCLVGESGRSCQGGSVCGRPFIIASEVRLAPAHTTPGWLRSDTSTEHAAVMAQPVSPELARRLADHWTAIGLMEHASIAAFARFTLQLLSMGAPLELIEASNRAQADEARHARLAFELATGYAGAPVGPGPLSLAGPLLDADWEAILRTTIEEGCIGETCAAMEAALAADLCAEPAVAQILRGIAEDEARHAALAWRAVQWMLALRPSLKTPAQRAFAEAAALTSSSTSGLSLTPRSPAEEHGALERATLAACRQRSIREVVLPCARQLFDPCAVARRPDSETRAARCL